MLFARIRPLCVQILNSPSASALAALVDILNAEDHLPPAIIEYVFFPLAHILRNTSTPDHILEHVFRALAVLAAHWDCSIEIWGQLVMLSTAVLAAPHDEETLLAVVLTLRALVRPDAPLPIVGRALDALLPHTASPNHDLQTTSLAVVLLLVKHYFGDDMPAILPGVVSTMARVALGPKTTAYAIQIALDLLAHAVQRAMSDRVCILHGALHDIRSLDDLLSPLGSQSTRTPSWLAGTASQLHIALNTLSPLVSHPNPIARLALANLAFSIIQACPRSLEKSQPLLLSHLLVLAYPALSASTPPEDARRALEHLHTLLADPLQIQPLASLASQALSLLPHRLTPTHQRSASSLARQLVTASTILPTIGALLGPSGGIEKWGRTLLTVLKFESKPLVHITTAQDLISTHSAPTHPYPPITLAALDADVHHHVENVFIAMGNAAHDQCAFAIEWFVALGTREGDDEMRVAALWCALMLLRGATKSAPSPRLTKAARWIITSVAELWDGRFQVANVEPAPTDDVLQVTEYVKGLDPLTTLLDRPTRSKPKPNRQVHLQHASLAIQLLSTSHMALCTTNSPAPLQYTLFPLLVSLVSDAPVLAWTAHTALGQISEALGYASLSNMLLANFDYALESVARRISLFSSYATTTPSSSPSISIQALQVLECLIRLVGRAIVDRATDVLDECFDRLDDFHGYSAVVCALVGVLAQVVAAIGREDEGGRIGGRAEPGPRTNERDDFFEWFKRRNEPRDSDFDLGKKDDDGDGDGEPPPLSPLQSLTRQIVARATYFLTHASPHVRAQILNLLATAAPTLRASAFLPTIHAAWPFILNRLDDKEPFVVVACAQLVQALVQSVGEFMARRVWDDVWPRFKKILEAQAEIAVTKVRRTARLGAEQYGPRALSDLHLAVLRTLGAAIEHVEPSDEAVWTILTRCRRFLAKDPSPGRDEWGERRDDVQKAARDLYTAIGKRNPDVVWLVLVGTCGRDPRTNQDVQVPAFLRSDEWDVLDNVVLVLNAIE
ncbi:hypothetical protein CTheo_4503 [Ceratobasidium theobromae]|uniref:Uncharacterized protein n=1 Tax=Ceratobasidium theobromae TaxID=1582974 RepID=A0A5N5QKP6_9AGAM|nr:hypothetical protein CTheo_4503 [Ceratobasidium theobromae]